MTYVFESKSKRWWQKDIVEGCKGTKINPEHTLKNNYLLQLLLEQKQQLQNLIKKEP